MKKCIDCGESLRNMSPLAKRCKKCRRKFQDISSYIKKKKDRAKLSKQKTLVKVQRNGLSDEIAEKAKEKVIEEVGTKEEITKNTEKEMVENLKNAEAEQFPYLSTSLPKLWYGSKNDEFNDFLDKKIKRIVKEEIEKKFKHVLKEIKEYKVAAQIDWNLIFDECELEAELEYKDNQYRYICPCCGSENINWRKEDYSTCPMCKAYVDLYIK